MKTYVLIHRPIYIIIIIIIGIFYLQSASSPKTWGLKPTCLGEQSKGIAVKSQMSQIGIKFKQEKLG